MQERIVLFQQRLKIGNLSHNFELMQKAIEKAQQDQASIIVFPELATCGYTPKDLLLNPKFVKEAIAINAELALLSTDNLMIIWGGLSKNNGKGKPLFNTGFMAHAGQIITQCHKVLLPTYNVFNDNRYFEAGQPEQANPIFIGPNGNTLTLSICEELWSHPALETSDDKKTLLPFDYQESIFSPIKLLNVDGLIHIAASPFSLDKPEVRLSSLQKIAAYEKCNILFCNQLATVDDVLFDGSCAMITSDNTILNLQPFEEGVLNTWQTQTNPPPTLSQPEQQFKAIVFAIKSYFNDTGFSKALLGLSGGVDSALVAVLASHALGPQNVKAVLMPGPYSSEHSVLDAQELCKNLGIENQSININKTFEQFLAEINPSANPLQDLAEQNLQARIRGTLLMTLSNRANSLVLATSNKSELAMGYSTLYGDSCGALAPIGDLYKTEVYALCHWINQKFGPTIPENTLKKAPSAELAPNQTDEASLGPYAELDMMLTDLINQGQLPTNPKQYEQFTRAEYKRRQFPIIPKVSAKAFGSGWQQLVSQNWQS